MKKSHTKPVVDASPVPPKSETNSNKDKEDGGGKSGEFDWTSSFVSFSSSSRASDVTVKAKASLAPSSSSASCPPSPAKKASSSSAKKTFPSSSLSSPSRKKATPPPSSALFPPVQTSSTTGSVKSSQLPSTTETKTSKSFEFSFEENRLNHMIKVGSTPPRRSSSSKIDSLKPNFSHMDQEVRENISRVHERLNEKLNKKEQSTVPLMGWGSAVSVPKEELKRKDHDAHRLELAGLMASLPGLSATAKETPELTSSPNTFLPGATEEYPLIRRSSFNPTPTDFLAARNHFYNLALPSQAQTQAQAEPSHLELTSSIPTSTLDPDAAVLLSRHTSALTTLHETFHSLVCSKQSVDTSMAREIEVWKRSYMTSETEKQRLADLVRVMELDLRKTLAQARRMEVKSELERASQPRFAVILIDGDSNVFHESLLCRGAEGGRSAAKKLLASLPGIIRSHLPKKEGQNHHELINNVLINLFVNRNGLANTLYKANLVPSIAVANDFFLGFSQAHANISGKFSTPLPVL